MRQRTAWDWIALGSAAAGLHLAIGRESAFIETYYSRGFFVGWRWAWDSTLGRSPVPWVYVFAAILLVAGAVRLAGILRRPRTKARVPLGKRIGSVLLKTTAWAGVFVFFFYLLWGFNYDRIGVAKRLGLEPLPLDSAALTVESGWAARLARISREAIRGAGPETLGEKAAITDLETSVRGALVSVLREAGYPTPGAPRVRTFRPGGWLMRFSSTGVYVPYVAEGYTDGDLLPFERPFTTAHEMAHGYGITDEGEASFMAFLACAASPNPAVRYSGYAAYWSQAAGELPRSGFKVQWDALPEGMKADLRAGEKNAARYRGALERVSRKVYAQYLKSQRVEDGLRSYSRFVGLVRAWKELEKILR